MSGTSWMLKPLTWTLIKRPWRKLSTQRQRRCSNPLLVLATWTRGVTKRTGPLRRRRRTLVERIYPPSPSLLILLVENSPLLFSRLPLPTQRRIKTTNKVFGAAEDGIDSVETSTPLSPLSILFPRKKGKTCPMSSAITAIGKDIISASVFGIQRRSQKTSDSLGNLHAGDCS